MRAADILLVEDESIVALHLRQQLVKLGYQVVGVASSGPSALRLIEERQPALVLMDIRIEGDLDGIETAGLLPRSCATAVIYLTAHAEEATLERARATRPYGYLMKPFSERDLHATIQMALERREADEIMRETQAALEQSREEFRYLFQNNPLPMWAFHRGDLRFLEVNDAAIRTYGYPRAEFLGMTLEQIQTPDGVERLKAVLEPEPTGPLRSDSWRHVRSDGSIIDVDVFSHALTFDGQPARLTVSIDVTDRKAAEEQLRQAQKMEAVGQLSGGIAHDFNNILGIVQGNLELLAERVGGDPEAGSCLEDALAATERAASLTHRLLAYARQQPLEPRAVDLARLVADMVALLKRMLGEAYDVRLQVPSDLWPAHIDGHQLENALLNLAVNARDAMPGGGRLTIEATNLVLDLRTAAPDVAPGPYVRLAVTDTGTGMAKSVLERALEPFFTTKPTGVGTGLGLSMVCGFVKQSHGHMAIDSAPGRGTTVTLYLPRAAAHPDAASAAVSSADQPARPGETILVVEDDRSLLHLSLERLARLGYATHAVPDGPAALAVLDRVERVDLLLTDVMLPNGMTGFQLAEAVQARRPGIRVVFMSGYSAAAIGHGGELTEGMHYLTKPFPKAELARQIRSALDG